MPLEDHLGDIIRKARQAAEVPVEAAAKVAGLNVEQFSAFEESGHALGQTNFKPLAELVALHPAKLENIARGWLPPAVDLSQWRELRPITTTQEGITVNCYLIWDEVSREAALFDTGWDAAPILTLVAEEKLHLKHLFLTHTDEDHVAAMGVLREQFPKLLIHTNSKNAQPQHRNRSNAFIHLGSLRITNRDTPGHTEDGVTYIIGTWPEDAPHVAIVGDTIFAGSLARGKQSTQLLKQKVREQIFTLPNETLVCPGHGPLTTVAVEKDNNPFF
jgi:hydroxyacylglutathione hydrolase